MEDNVLERMIDRFFEAQLSVDEERELYRYLLDNDVPSRLQREKEAVIALYGKDEPVELPVGAEERLAAMLDTLENRDAFPGENAAKAVPGFKKVRKIPRGFAGFVASAAAVALLLYIAVPLTEQPKTERKAPATKSYEPVEEDTFDDPKAALQCAKESIGEILLAMNSVQNSLDGIEKEFSGVVRANSKIKK